MRIRMLSVVCLLVAIVVGAAYATDFAVIVNPANPARAMTLVELGKMFKGKTAAWANGRNVTIVLHNPSSPEMKFVVEKVMGVEFGAGKEVLVDPVRKGMAPVVFLDSDEEIVKAVATNSGAVGIIDVYSINGSVKVIKIDEKQPFDPGYALKGH
jgi:ABC-type phosphate transport system substrate-binding protein